MAELRLMVGRIPELKVTKLDADERKLFDNDFELLTTELSRIDSEFGQSLSEQKPFYVHAAEVAKGYFENKPFGSLRPGSGQYGMRFMRPQDIGTIDWTTLQSTVHSWAYTHTAGANDLWDDLWNLTRIAPSTTSERRSLHAFHALYSLRPGTKLVSFIWTVNRLPYSDVSVEPYARIEKPFKTFKLIPLPGQLLVHPGGEYRARASVDKYPTAFGTSVTFTEEVAILGLLFAEYDYLKEEIK